MSFAQKHKNTIYPKKKSLPSYIHIQFSNPTPLAKKKETTISENCTLKDLDPALKPNVQTSRTFRTVSFCGFGVIFKRNCTLHQSSEISTAAAREGIMVAAIHVMPFRIPVETCLVAGSWGSNVRHSLKYNSAQRQNNSKQPQPEL